MGRNPEKRGVRRGDEVHQDVQLDGIKKRVVEETRRGGGGAGFQEKGAGPEEGKGWGQRRKTFPVGQQ